LKISPSHQILYTVNNWDFYSNKDTQLNMKFRISILCSSGITQRNSTDKQIGLFNIFR